MREAYIEFENWIKPKIGMMPTWGYSARRLNVDGFLSYLAADERFRSAFTIYVPCGRADKLFHGDVKAICPAMTKLMHRTWLMVNGNVRHQC